MPRSFLTLLTILALLASLNILETGVSPAMAAEPSQTDCRTFQITGQTVCGKFLQYWDSHGGLAQQGFPISAVFSEQNPPPPAGDGKIHMVQYFERARFEEHLEYAETPYEIELGLIGKEQYQSKYASGAPAKVLDFANCKSFTQTGKSVCGTFMGYWNGHGGLAQYGYPISDVFMETNAPPPAGDGQVHRVQYFERARFEEHLEATIQFDVQLGLLGREQFKSKKTFETPWCTLSNSNSGLTTTSTGLKLLDLETGTGSEVVAGKTATVNYTLFLSSGKKVDSTIDRGQPFPFKVGAGTVIKGFDEGIIGMKVGGKRCLIIPPNLAYGSPGYPPVIPGDATLTFDIELLNLE
jgi:peptidylprolyl isomerase